MASGGRIKIGAIFLIATLSIAFSSNIGTLYVSNSITYPIMSVWIVLAIIFAINENGRKLESIVCNAFLRGNLYIKIIIYIYTILLIFTGLTEERFFSSNIQTFINAVSAISVFYIFGRNAFKYSIFALSIAYFVAVSGSIVSGTFFFELHDMAFGTGFLIIYYFMGKEKLYRSDMKWVWLILVVTIVAFKRIEMIALMIVIAVYFSLNSFSESKQRKLIRFFSIFFVFGLYVFIITSYNGSLIALADSIGINMMGRNYYYDIINYYTTFSAAFIGMGRNAMAVLFTNEYAYMNVGNIHSDILRMYAECGFYVFAIWLYVYFRRFPKLIESIFGFKTMKVFILCTYYLFITYLTDNTELYLVTQYFYILIPMYVAYHENERKDLETNENLSEYPDHFRKTRIRLRW